MLVAIEPAQVEIVAHRHRGDAAVAQRLLRQHADPTGLRLRARRMVLRPGDGDLAGGTFALARQHFDELGLAVAGHARHPEDLARTDLELRDIQSGAPEVAVGAQRTNGQARLGGRGAASLAARRNMQLADHQRGQLRGAELARAA